MMSTLAIDNGAQIAPDYRVKLAGSDITADISRRLISLSLTDNRGFEADQLDIALSDADGLMQMPPRGAVLSIFLGWKGQALIHKGEFTVDEVEHRGAPDTLTLRARSADYRGSLNSRRDHSYHDTTLEAIVSTVAARNDLQSAVADAFKGVKVSHIDQTQENDAAFITRLAELNGGVVAIKAGKLLFIKPGAAVTASGKPIPKTTLTRSDGDGHTFTVADRDAYTGVSATWLHTKDPKPKKVKVQRKKKEQHLRALQHPAAKKTTAKAQKTPEAKEGEYLAGSDENVFALTTVYATQKAAMRAAQAKWNKLQRGVAEFSISLARGRADLFPETPVAVSGFKSVIDAQPWLISKVTHNLDGSGFVTTLNLEVLLSDVSYEATESHDAE
ncbi:D protein bacteriophage 186 and P2 [Rahnella aceris]|uniref:D protein bacteriophage 186 and P2 n=1 Tax=Rahnella sp. (strain Y9602) TaxID=2703885 RepID=A0A0H3F8B5_RAHSY|nr:phage late control D family protein [Rahnella aceris]ADW73123.1 D protein bacteriophage 186 and P2 [Rahnella aceris]MBU9841439.1 phage late control D family protein [Rahnella aceris]